MNNVFTIALIVTICGCICSAPSAETEKPNVLMIAIDDLSDYVSLLQNHPGIKTPNLDRLAQRSINFTRAYCAAPICNPSRVAVNTGMAPHQTGVHQLGDLIENAPVVLASIALEEQFLRHGYHTYLTGKYYHANPDRWWPEDRLATMWTEKKPPFSDHGPTSANANKIMGGGIKAIGPAAGGMNAMPDVAILKNTQGWLQQPHEKPFFLVHGISKPHLAFIVPQMFFDLYPLESVMVPETIANDYADIPSFVRSTFFDKGDFEVFAKIRAKKNGWKEVMQAYMASISFSDWIVGQIMDALDASAYAHNTIIILWSDHGYHIGEKEWLHKRTLWTQSTRVPFLISIPGMRTNGRTCAAPVSLMDIYPSLNALCHFEQKVPQVLGGHDLSPLLNNPDTDWPYVALTSHDVGNVAINDARYHYIHYADGSDELYDNQLDPHEFTNINHLPHSKPIIERLSASIPMTWQPTGSKNSKKVKNDDD